MYKILSLMLGVCMVMAATAHSAQSAGADTKLARLPNGMSVLLVQDSRFPLVSTRLLVRTGASYETDGIAGISHLLEHMVFKGTSKRPGGETSRQVEAAGGYLNAYTSYDNTCYLTDMPAAQWKLGMDVVKDMAFHPKLDPKELEPEKDVVIAELKRGKDSPMGSLFENMITTTLKGTPYGRPIIGFEKTVRAITAEGMRAYIKQYYQPQNMLLVVVGDIDMDAVMTEARRQFGTLKNTSEIATRQPLDVRTLPQGVQVSVQPGPWNKVYLGLSFPTPGQRDMRNVNLDILSDLLTGDDAAWLSRKYTYERQLVDSISASNQNFADVGLFSIVVTLDADKLPEFWQAFVKDMAALKASDFTEEELRRAKVKVEDSFQRDKETLESRASWMGFLEFSMGGQDAGANLLEAYRGVTLAGVQQALDDWIRPERLNVQGFYPKDSTEPDLRTALAQAWPPAADAAAQAAAAVAPVETVDLEHGRRVVLIHDTNMPYTSVDMFFTGGDALLPPDRQGLGALTARVLTAGTASYTAQELEKYLSGRAATLSALSGRQSFGLSMRQPSRFNAELLPLFQEVLIQPSFLLEELTREKRLQTAAITRQNDQPQGLAFTRLGGLLYPAHPYGYAPLGTAEGIAGYDVSDVKVFWEKQRRQPWVLAVAGDFDRKAVLDFARTLPVPEDAAVQPATPEWGTEKTLKLTLPDRKQAHLLLVFKAVPAMHKDAPAFALLQDVLNGQGGLLFTELRDKQGLGYSVGAISRLTAASGWMAFYIGTDVDKVEQAKGAFADIIRRLQEKPLPAAVLKASCNQMNGSYYRERQTLGSRSSEAAILLTVGQPLDYEKDIIASAAKLKPADVQKLAKQYLRMQDAYVVTVLPE